MVRFLGVFSVLFFLLSQSASAGAPPGGFPWPNDPEQSNPKQELPPKQEQGPKQELPPKQDLPPQQEQGQQQEQGPKQELPPLKEQGPQKDQGKQEQSPGQSLPPMGQELPPMGGQGYPTMGEQLPPPQQYPMPAASLCYGLFQGGYYGQPEAAMQLEPAGNYGQIHVTAWQYGRVWQGVGRCWQNSPWNANVEIYFPAAPVQRGVVAVQGIWVVLQGQVDGGAPFRFFRQR